MILYSSTNNLIQLVLKYKHNANYKGKENFAGAPSD